jgi:hypothetical protein
LDKFNESPDKLLKLQRLYQLYENVSWMRQDEPKIPDIQFLELQNIIFDIKFSSPNTATDPVPDCEEFDYILKKYFY